MVKSMYTDVHVNIITYTSNNKTVVYLYFRDCSIVI